MTRVLDEENDREAVLARFVSSLSGRDEELLRKMLGDPRLADPEEGAIRPPDTGQASGAQANGKQANGMRANGARANGARAGREPVRPEPGG
jgi:hypothetical protein